MFPCLACMWLWWFKPVFGNYVIIDLTCLYDSYSYYLIHCVLNGIDVLMFQYHTLIDLHFYSTVERVGSHSDEMKGIIEKTDDGMASLKITGKSSLDSLQTLPNISEIV